MSRSSFYGLVTATASILLITLGLGQACSSNFSSNLPSAKVPGTSLFVGVASNGNGGGYSGMASNGNGGGYSGLQSISQGPYGGGADELHPRGHSQVHHHSYAFRSTTSILQSADDLYLHVESHNGCEVYRTGWNLAGPSINGMVAVEYDDQDNAIMTYISSACLLPSASKSGVVSSTMQILDFDPATAIFRNDIYQLASASPPDLNSLETILAYCHSDITKTPTGDDLGLAVKVYRRGQQLLATINYGSQNSSGDGATRYSVPAFAVTESTTGTQATYMTTGFELGVTTSGGLPSLGSFSASLDGKQVALAMKCWH